MVAHTLYSLDSAGVGEERFLCKCLIEEWVPLCGPLDGRRTLFDSPIRAEKSIASITSAQFVPLNRGTW